MSLASPSATAPRCSRHPEVAAPVVCSRCGNFLCEACAVEREPAVLCADCIARRDGSTMGEPFSIGSALSRGGQLFIKAFVPIAVISCLFGVLDGVADRLLQEAGVGLVQRSWATLILGGTVGLIGTNAVILAMIDAARGQEPRLGASLLAGARNWGSIFLVNLEVGIRIVLWSLLLVIPGIIEAVKLSLAVSSALVKDDEFRPVESSRSLVFGHGGEMFAVLIVIGVVPLVLTAGLGAVLRVLWLVREAAPVVSWVKPLITHSLARLCAAFGHAVTLAAYFGLRRSAQLKNEAIV